jgi:four helix bundle protein
MEIKSHRDLVVWQKAMDLAVEIYRLVKNLPREETYGLVSQMTRAAASVPANIAEGHARGTARDYANFLAIARGSLVELETYLLLAVRIGYLQRPQAQVAEGLAAEACKMLNSLRRKLLNLRTSNLKPGT